MWKIKTTDLNRKAADSRYPVISCRTAATSTALSEGRVGLEVPLTLRISGPLVPPAAFEVSTDSLPGALGKLWELSSTSVNDGLNLFFRLFADGDHAVKVLVNKQTHKHLEEHRT
ncbi:hypothetical protein E2C01_020273 [Portunus trituberculatus]|uniref:Uncharacterized protein n=1 Tax=Portunus trituberculatus TaxID=210409 RepID=A0A5B7E1K1_PORTR|nr:hypothetical protein [Portunus trituberculatus]